MVEELPVFLHIFLHGEYITLTCSVLSLAHKSPMCNKTVQMFDDASSFLSEQETPLAVMVIVNLFLNSVAVFFSNDSERKIQYFELFYRS